MLPGSKKFIGIDLLVSSFVEVDGEYIRPNQNGCWRVMSWEESRNVLRTLIINYFSNKMLRLVDPNWKKEILHRQ